MMRQTPWVAVRSCCGKRRLSVGLLSQIASTSNLIGFGFYSQLILYCLSACGRLC
jgi:hypothetical protein